MEQNEMGLKKISKIYQLPFFIYCLEVFVLQWSVVFIVTVYLPPEYSSCHALVIVCLHSIDKTLHIWKTGPLDVQTSRRWKENQQDYHNLRRALCVGYANQLAERMVYHNGYRTLGFKPQVVQV